MSITRIIRVLDGAIVTLPFDCRVVVENESASIVTTNIKMSLNDSTMVQSSEAGQFLKSDVSKFNSATPSASFYKIGDVNANSAMIYSQKLHGGSQLQIVGGNCTITMYNIID